MENLLYFPSYCSFLTSITPCFIQVSITGDSPHGEEYFMNRAIKNDETMFRKVGVTPETINNVNKMIETETKSFSEKLTSIISDSDSVRLLLPNIEELQRSILSFSSHHIFTTKNDPMSLILFIETDSFTIMTKSFAESERLISQLTTDFQKINSITKDFGLEFVSLVYGEKYGSWILSRVADGLKTIKSIPKKNQFEEEVIKFVSSITNCSLSNVEISYETPNEVFEYDVLIPFSTNRVLDVEVKDYSTVKDDIREGSETIKSKLILSTLDKAKRLDAEVIVIAKGFPVETFDKMKEFATSRSVILLNEINYKDELTKILINRVVTSVEPPRRRLRRVRVGRDEYRMIPAE
jgi:hypothetical protein